MTQGRIDIITMGCSKNLVDSERLMSMLAAKGYDMHHDSHDVSGEVVVVNTCGFIGDAKQESIDMILNLIEAKTNGKIGAVYVMGCLSQRYLNELQEELEEVDGWYGKFDWDRIVDSLPDKTNTAITAKPWERIITTGPSSAFIKISEGCDRMCAYCAIPLITGRHRSRPESEIIDEVKSLVAQGVKEFNVIAQDLSTYGRDLAGGESRLASLIDAMADVPGVKWIRLHYAYPVDFPWDVLEVMRRHENVCKYLDIALQHISTPVLQGMRRHIDREQTLELIARIRREVPGIALRTTLMTGFPGEGDAEYDELTEFVKAARFERLGVFAYSEEEGTWAARHLKDEIPQEIKDERRDALLDIHESQALELNEALVGQEVTVMIDNGIDEEVVGRTQWDSPDVDHLVHIDVPDDMEMPTPGDFVRVRITDALPYDLYAEMI